MDRLLNFKCSNCKNCIIDFETPKICEDCGAENTLSPCFSSVSTVSVSEGIMYEYMYDSAASLSERNEVYDNDFEENKNRTVVSDIRNGKLEAVQEKRTTESLESLIDEGD